MPRPSAPAVSGPPPPVRSPGPPRGNARVPTGVSRSGRGRRPSLGPRRETNVADQSRGYERRRYGGSSAQEPSRVKVWRSRISATTAVNAAGAGEGQTVLDRLEAGHVAALLTAPEARALCVCGLGGRPCWKRMSTRSPDKRRVWTWRATSTDAVDAAPSLRGGRAEALPSPRLVPPARHPSSPVRHPGRYGRTGARGRAGRPGTCDGWQENPAPRTSLAPVSSTCRSPELEQGCAGPGRGAIAPVGARQGGKPRPTVLEVLTWETSVCCTSVPCCS
jgi:hypothetical protein